MSPSPSRVSVGARPAPCLSLSVAASCLSLFVAAPGRVLSPLVICLHSRRLSSQNSSEILQRTLQQLPISQPTGTTIGPADAATHDATAHDATAHGATADAAPTDAAPTDAAPTNAAPTNAAAATARGHAGSPQITPLELVSPLELNHPLLSSSDLSLCCSPA